MKNNDIKIVISIVLSALCFPPCMAFESEEETFEETEAPAISKPLHPTHLVTPFLTPKEPSVSISTPTPTTQQQKLERDIIATMQELKTVVEELKPFDKTPEAQKIRKDKQEAIKKRDEQAAQRKARLDSSRWRPSTSSYPSYSPSSFRSPWGGGGGDPWSPRGDSSWSPSSGTGTSWPGETPSKLSTPEELKKSSTGTSGDKAPTGEEKDRGKSVVGEQGKEILAAYNKAVGAAKQAANKLQTALSGHGNKTDIEVAQEILRRGRLRGLSAQIEKFTEEYDNLNTSLGGEEKLQNFDKGRGDLLQKEKSRLEGLLSSAFKPLLFAATLQKDGEGMKDIWNGAQGDAVTFLNSDAMSKYVKGKDQTINERAHALLEIWKKGDDGKKYDNSTFNVKHLNPATRALGSAPKPGVGQNKNDLVTYFNNQKTKIADLIAKFPTETEPTPLVEKIKTIEDDLQKANALP